ncbi:MAG: hypothetical protein ACI8QT_000414 [Halioglobus sp.]|jgi:hypothetical protein
MPGEGTNDKKNLIRRVIEDLRAKRDITVSYEYIRLWCIKFGPIYTRRVKRKREITVIHSTSMQFFSRYKMAHLPRCFSVTAGPSPSCAITCPGEN